MAESPIIYLHVGHGKAASSTIQSFLQSNADEIRRQGLLIADVDFEFPRTGPVRGYPFQILWDWIVVPEFRTASLSEALHRVAESCRQGGFRGAVISSELLGSAEAAKWVGDSTGDLPVHVIYYVRRQDQWLESAWKQLGLKDGTGLEDFVKRSTEAGQPAFLDAARAWRDAADHLIVRPIEGVEDIQAHFADWCGLDFDRLQPVKRANRTFDWALLDLFSRNAFLFDDTHDNRLFNALERLLPEDAPRDGHGMMTEELAGEVWSACEKKNRALRREFFPDLPECEWDFPPDPEAEFGGSERFGSPESVFRNLAIQLMILRDLDQRLTLGSTVDRRLSDLDERADRIGESITRRFNRLRSRLEREETRRQALEQRVEQLESRTGRRFFPGRLKAWWRRRKAGPNSIDSE